MIVGLSGDKLETSAPASPIDLCVGDTYNRNLVLTEVHILMLIIKYNNSFVAQGPVDLISSIDDVVISDHGETTAWRMQTCDVAAMVRGGTRPPPRGCKLT